MLEELFKVTQLLLLEVVEQVDRVEEVEAMVVTRLEVQHQTGTPRVLVEVRQTAV
jgi:hypothetical protein